MTIEQDHIARRLVPTYPEYTTIYDPRMQNYSPYAEIFKKLGPYYADAGPGWIMVSNDHVDEVIKILDSYPENPEAEQANPQKSPFENFVNDRVKDLSLEPQQDIERLRRELEAKQKRLEALEEAKKIIGSLKKLSEPIKIESPTLAKAVSDLLTRKYRSEREESIKSSCIYSLYTNLGSWGNGAKTGVAIHKIRIPEWDREFFLFRQFVEEDSKLVIIASTMLEIKAHLEFERLHRTDFLWEHDHHYNELLSFLDQETTA